MTPRIKKTPVPQERTKTIRQELCELLREERLSVRDLSQIVGKSEKEVLQQLSHIGKSVALMMEPSECLKCGFVFERRNRPKKPGKCPKCQSTRISSPTFAIQ